MSVPTFEETMLPIMKLMSDEKGRTNGEIKHDLIKIMNLSEEDMKVRNGAGTIKFYDNVGFAISYLFLAGLLDRPKRNYYLISDSGKNVLKRDITYLNTNYLKKMNPEFAKRIGYGGLSKKKNDNNQATEDCNESKLSPSELITKNETIIKEGIKEELLSNLKQGSPDFFEKVCKDLMLAMGYGYDDKDSGKVTQHSNDGGIDGIIYADRLGLEKIYLQAKKFDNSSVGRPDVQSFKGAIDNNKGVFITTSKFTQEAKEYAKKYDNIILIDGNSLVDLMYANGVGVRIVSTHIIKAIDKDYFEDE